MGAGGAVTPDTAITLSISKLAGLLGIKPTLLKDILGTSQVELRDQPKIVAGGIDTERDMGFWTFFNKIGSIHTLNTSREAALHHLNRKILNGAVNDGAHTFLFEPAVNSMVLIHFVATMNLDAAGVWSLGRLRTAGGVNVSMLWYLSPLPAGENIQYPCNGLDDQQIGHTANPAMILTDAFEIRMETGVVAVSEDTNFYILYTYIGDAPTVTEGGPAGATFADVA